MIRIDMYVGLLFNEGWNRNKNSFFLSNMMLKIFFIRLFYNYIFLFFNVGGCKYVIYFVGFSKIEL